MGFFDFFGNKNNEKKNTIEALKSIEVENGTFLPKAFAEHWQEIKATGIEYIEIKATPSTNIKITDSHFGYIPFVPSKFDCPVDSENNPMIPLAQLNFSDIPALPDYPTKGLLQFYIRNDDCYGLDFDNQYNPQSFRVVYIENPESLELNSDTSFLEKLMRSENSPVSKSHKLSFNKKIDYVGLNDCRNDSHGFSVNDWIDQYKGEVNRKLEDLSYDLFCTNGHKIGGYAYFTQSDPRDNNGDDSNSILLFQMDSDDEIMWGDVGVGNFFIKQNDLLNKDFTKVMYNWDCC